MFDKHGLWNWCPAMLMVMCRKWRWALSVINNLRWLHWPDSIHVVTNNQNSITVWLCCKHVGIPIFLGIQLVTMQCMVGLRVTSISKTSWIYSAILTYRSQVWMTNGRATTNISFSGLSSRSTWVSWHQTELIVVIANKVLLLFLCSVSQRLQWDCEQDL